MQQEENMELTQKYLNCFGAMSSLIADRTKEKKYIALGLASNLDLICEFDIAILNQMIDQYLPDADLTKMKAFRFISSMEELVETFVYYCLHGLGGEAEIENADLIEKHFKWNHAIGGTGVQAAMALAELGCKSVNHLTDDSKEVCQVLASPYVFVVDQKGMLTSTMEAQQLQKQEIHYVIQFRKGEVLQSDEQAFEIPASNRLIVVKMTVNKIVPFYEPYFRFIENNAKQITSHVISSFNEISDLQILDQRLEYLGNHVIKYRQANPRGIVFFEEAHYHNDCARVFCMEKLYPKVDIVSMNEEELVHISKMHDMVVEIENIVSCVEALQKIREICGVQKGMVVHTKDYAMYVGNPLEIDMEAGLIYGNMIAAAKAMHGSYGTKEQIAKLLELEFSATGLRKYCDLQNSRYAAKAVLVPSKYMDKPPFTIGLGDSFTAGLQLCFT